MGCDVMEIRWHRTENGNTEFAQVMIRRTTSPEASGYIALSSHELSQGGCVELDTVIGQLREAIGNVMSGAQARKSFTLEVRITGIRGYENGGI